MGDSIVLSTRSESLSSLSEMDIKQPRQYAKRWETRECCLSEKLRDNGFRMRANPLWWDFQIWVEGRHFKSFIYTSALIHEEETGQPTFKTGHENRRNFFTFICSWRLLTSILIWSSKPWMLYPGSLILDSQTPYFKNYGFGCCGLWWINRRSAEPSKINGGVSL